MNKGELFGFFRWLLPVPASVLQNKTDTLLRHLNGEFTFLTEELRQVHQVAVRRLIETGKPLRTESLADGTGISPRQIDRALDELEKHPGLIKRNAAGQITQAYPVTLEETRYRLVISLGEEVYGAGAIGALAASYVLGQLNNTRISGHITAACAGCRRPAHIIIDSKLSFRVVEQTPEQLLFVPFAGPGNAIDYLQESVFYCSEAHAAEQRKKAGGKRGAYLAPERGIELARRIMAIIFNFPE